MKTKALLRALLLLLAATAAPAAHGTVSRRLAVKKVPGTNRTLDFVIAGAAKAGTTALGNHLRKCVPQCCLSRGPRGGEEDHSMDHGPGRGNTSAPQRDCDVSSPASRFGLESPVIVHLFDERIARGWNQAYPRMKFIILLREPIQRTFSHWSMNNHGRAPLAKFTRDVKEEIAKKRPARRTYRDVVWRGFYGEQLGRFYACCRGRVKVVVSERVFASPGAIARQYNEVLAFLGVPRVRVFKGVFERKGKNGARAIPGDAIRALRALFVHDTQRLYGLLGGAIREWEAWYAARNVTRIP